LAITYGRLCQRAAKDTVIMTYVQVNGYIVFTNDLDFGTLLAIQRVNLPSVVQVRTQDLLLAAIGDLVVSALQQFRSELEQGSLLTIDSSRLRVRILPIVRD
jgi:predicted nuclease of predicted toxin-antitoxin system